MITVNTRKFHTSPTKLVGYSFSAHNDGSGQETLAVKTSQPLAEIEAITWTMRSSAGHIALYWQGSGANPNILITYITAPTGIFNFEELFLQMKVPANCTGNVLLSTEDFVNKDTYTIILKAKEA